MQTVLMTLMFAGSIALAALWGGGRDGVAMAVPLLPLLVIHAAGLRAPRSVPSWLVFAGGLLVDLGTHGPLGYWPLIYLVGLMMAHLVPEAMAQRPGVRAALGVAAIVALAVLQFIVMALYRLAIPDIAAIALAAAIIGSCLAALEAILPFGIPRHRGFGAETAALQRGE